MRATTPPDSQECECDSQEIKDAVSKAPVLKYFSEIDLTETLGDASKDALGFV